MNGRFHTARRVLPLLAGLLLAGACVSAPNPFEAGQGDTVIQLDVRNRNFADATIYVRRMGQPIRLGIVRSQASEIFDIPWPASLAIQVEARFLGGERCLSREIMVNDGDQLIIELPANLSMGGLCIAR